jgi:hypothetical protein
MMDNGAFLKAGAFKSTKNSVRALFYLILFPYIDNTSLSAFGVGRVSSGEYK